MAQFNKKLKNKKKIKKIDKPNFNWETPLYNHYQNYMVPIYTSKSFLTLQIEAKIKKWIGRASAFSAYLQ